MAATGEARRMLLRDGTSAAGRHNGVHRNAAESLGDNPKDWRREMASTARGQDSAGPFHI